ncbi:alpha/beta-hydrolase [Mytilinidion resinicola]|uniref:Alpha/beta-hydrolase n=1 Tax=Mytilinidion resinicola TaxID=574789 RepID=A0A6A6YFQ7_9PEZI|nr:alpha/beta-hydrolase [Mytilinidion resinicola]KAF2807641.1 alpha/beta-hydrolase [Mytilinidion resinicola]
MVASNPETRFDAFHHHTIPYKTINNQPIDAELLIPKAITPGPHPLVAQFHGGGLFTGKALYADWFPPYLVSFALANAAVIVAPNYRLLPEHSGADVLADLADFWAWLHGALPALLSSKAEGVTADLDRLLVAGESAGGWLALQSVYSLPAGTIKAMHLPYPMSQPLPGGNKKEMMGMSLPDAAAVEAWLAAIKPGVVVSSAAPPARLLEGLALMQQPGRRTQFLGEGKRFNPYEGLDDATWFPRTWVIHGADDEVVSVDYSVQLVEKLDRLFPGKARLTVKPGNHGFDGEVDPEKEEWLKEGLEWVREAWLL